MATISHKALNMNQEVAKLRLDSYALTVQQAIQFVNSTKVQKGLLGQSKTFLEIGKDIKLEIPKALTVKDLEAPPTWLFQPQYKVIFEKLGIELKTTWSDQKRFPQPTPIPKYGWIVRRIQINNFFFPSYAWYESGVKDRALEKNMNPLWDDAEGLLCFNQLHQQFTHTKQNGQDIFLPYVTGKEQETFYPNIVLDKDDDLEISAACGCYVPNAYTILSYVWVEPYLPDSTPSPSPSPSPNPSFPKKFTIKGLIEAEE